MTAVVITLCIYVLIGTTFAGFRQVCDRVKAPYGCSRVPRDQDAVLVGTFLQKVNATPYAIPWRIDGIGMIRDNLFPYYMIENSILLRGNTTGANMSLVNFIYRDSNSTQSVCRNGADQHGKMVDGLRGIFDIGTSRSWMLSRDPASYLLLFVCADKEAVIDNMCYAKWYVNVCVPPGRLDNPPMREVVDDLSWHLGLSLDNELTTFLQRGHPCRDELTTP